MCSKKDPDGKDKIDFIKEDYKSIKSHMIATYITAESPDERFKYTIELIEQIKFQSSVKVEILDHLTVESAALFQVFKHLKE